MEGEVDVDLCHLLFSRPRVLAGEKIRGRRREGKHVLENRRVLDEWLPIHFECDVRSEEYDASIFVPELFISRKIPPVLMLARMVAVS